MSDLICSFAYAAPFVLIGVVFVGQMIMRRRHAPALQQMRQDLRADAIAQRLELSLVEGDPSFTFIQMGAVDVAQRRVLMRGQSQGYPLELLYEYSREHEADFVDTRVTTRFLCQLSAPAQQPFPPFEVMSRHVGAIVPRQPLLPEAQTGDANVDSNYLVRTAEPRLAELLGRAVAKAHATLGPVGIHLSGDGRNVSLVMHEKTRPHPGEVLRHPETAAALVVEITRGVGG